MNDFQVVTDYITQDGFNLLVTLCLVLIDS